MDRDQSGDVPNSRDEWHREQKDGWPTHGFSQSSGIHDVWNFWIIYPVIGIALILGGRARAVYGHRPISESEIKHELDRQKGTR